MNALEFLESPQEKILSAEQFLAVGVDHLKQTDSPDPSVEGGRSALEFLESSRDIQWDNVDEPGPPPSAARKVLLDEMTMDENDKALTAKEILTGEIDETPWHKKKISLPEGIDPEAWEKGVADIEASAKRVKEGLISPGAPFGALETAAHLGTMTYGVPAMGIGHIIDLATEGKYNVAEKMGQRLIYQPQLESGEVIRDILFSPFYVAEKVGARRADSLFDELVEKYGPEDIRTSAYPAIRKTMWDIFGILTTGKAGHIPRTPKAKMPMEASKLDTTFAKDQILTRMAKEKAEVGERPLDILGKKEAGLKGEIPIVGKRAKRFAEIETAITELGDKERLAEMKEPYEGTPAILEKQPKPEIEMRTVEEKSGETFLKKATEAVGGKWGVKERGIELQKDPRTGEYGLKITDRSIPESRKRIAESQVNALLKEGKSAEEVASVFENFLRDNQTLKGKEGLVKQLKEEVRRVGEEPEFGSKLEGIRQQETKIAKQQAIAEQVKADLAKFGQGKRVIKDVIKDVNAVFGERGEIGKAALTSDQQAALTRLSGDMDVITRNAKRTAKTVERYLIDLKFDPKVAALLSRKAEDIQKHARSVKPPKAVDFLTPEPAPVKTSQTAQTLKATIDRLEEGQRPIKGFLSTARRTKEGLSEAIHSPERVYERDPVIGKKIYQTVDRADQQKNAFLATEGQELVDVAKKVKEGSNSSIKIGKALDGKIDPKNLHPVEKQVYDFMKGKYDFLIQKYARQAAGSEEGYLKVLRAATNERRPYVKVSSLPEKAQAGYGQLKDELVKIRKGGALKALNKAETEKYWDVRKKMTNILEDQWKENLSHGEREAYDVLSSRIKDYLPHLFDKDVLLDSFKNELSTLKKKLSTATNKGAVTGYKNRIRMLEDSVIKMKKGYLVTYDALPTNVRFRFFETRKGKAGYSFDAVKAYQTYIHGIARKLYDEPAIRYVAELHKELDPSLKAYNKWYIRHYMGWDRNKLDSLAGAVSSFQWMRCLGASPRSAIVNLTQRLNTVAEIGVKHSLKGEAMGFTKKGKALFDSTGIAKEVPTVLLEGPVPEGMEKLRAILGYMFNKVELGNRKHAFLSGYSKAKAGGISETEAIRQGVDAVHKTQFRYGKVGMPKALTHPVGRLAGQFWSYPIKQTELLIDWAKNDPAKLVKYLAYAEGGNYALNEFVGVDLSNALGIGLNYGEAIKVIRDVPEKDWKGFWRHVRLTFSGGGGLLPSGFGPTASGALKVAQRAKKGKALEALGKELTPVMAKRVVQAYKAVRDKRGDLYPMKNANGHIMYYLTSKELITRTIGPRPSKESKEYLEWKKASMLERERKEVLQDITRAIVDDDMNTANKLIEKYQVVPTDKAIENEILKRNLSREERAAMKPPGKKKEYQSQREGQESAPQNLSEEYKQACETISKGKFPLGVVKEKNRVEKRLNYLRKEVRKVGKDRRYSAKQRKNRVKKIEVDIAKEQGTFLKYMESK